MSRRSSALAAGLGFWLIAVSAMAASPATMLALSEESLPAAVASPSASPQSTASSSATPEASPSGAAAASGTPAAPATSPEAGPTPAEAQPGAAGDVPPPTDLSNVPVSAPVSSSSLEPLIQKTTDASLSASLRITEEARQQVGENHPEEAVRTLGHALSIDAGNPYAYFYLGRAYLMKKDYKQALTFFSRAELGLGSDLPWLGETVGFEGACYEELGRDRDAALAYQRALQLGPGNLMARAGYGRLAAALPPPPVPPEEQPSAENADQAPPEENDVRTVPAGEPLETAPLQSPPPSAPKANPPPSN